MTNRVTYIDIAKGISIILVAVFHSSLKYYSPSFIDFSLIRMPIFFFISGIFFSISTNTYTFLWKKTEALLKPYFITLLALFIVSVLLEEKNLQWTLAGIFYGNGHTIEWTPMWFLTHLFAIYVFTYIIFKLTNIQEKNNFYKTIFVIILIVIGTQNIDMFRYIQTTLSGKELIVMGLPFSLDLILVSSSFFIAGTFLKKTIIIFNPNIYAIIASVLILIVISIYTDASIDMNERIYKNPLFATIAAICGIYFVLSISYYLDKTIFLRKILLMFGQASLFILIFHAYIGFMAVKFVIWLGLKEPSLWLAMILFLISISVPLLIRTIVLKSKFLSYIYLPVKSKNTN